MMLPRTLRKFLSRMIEGAGGGPRGALLPMLAAANRRLEAQRHILSGRAAAIVVNTTVGSAIKNFIVTSALIDGVTARSLHPNRAMAAALEDAFARFQDVAVLEGNMDLSAFTNLLLGSVIVTGEGIVRDVVTENGELRLQQLQSEQLDDSRNEELADGGRIKRGIQTDAMGRIVGYWLHPNLDDTRTSRASVFIPRDDVQHVFEAVTPGQQRGASWFTPAITAIHAFDQLLDACIETAKTKALFTGFVKNLDGGSTVASDMAALQPMMPGAMVELPVGCDVTFAEPGDMSSLDSVLRASARQICAAMGVPYEPIFDLSQTNYSSNKAGFESFKRRVRVIRNMLTSRFLQPVWERFVTLEILSGRIRAADYARDPRAYFAATWLWSEWASLEPLKEAQANAILLQTGLASRQQLVEASGREFAALQSEIDADTFEPAPSNVVPITPATEAA